MSLLRSTWLLPLTMLEAMEHRVDFQTWTVPCLIDVETRYSMSYSHSIKQTAAVVTFPKLSQDTTRSGSGGIVAETEACYIRKIL